MKMAVIIGKGDSMLPQVHPHPTKLFTLAVLFALGALLSLVLMSSTAFASGGPTVTTNSASTVTVTRATLMGSVNPNGSSTTYHFDYATDAYYTANGNTYSSTTATFSAGSGALPLSKSATLISLSPGTEYHFRIEATNSGGTAYGADHTLATGLSNTGSPVISGTYAVGQTLSAPSGSWSPSATMYRYVWIRCTANGLSCSQISATTTITSSPTDNYTLTSSDMGWTVESMVEAHSAIDQFNSDDAPSVPTGIVS